MAVSNFTCGHSILRERIMNTIKLYNGNNAPLGILKYVKISADHIIVIPKEYFEDVLKVIVARKIEHHVYDRNNKARDMIIATREY